MPTRTLFLLAAVASTTALAQVQVNIQVPMPTIMFGEPPPLVVVQPGVQVVEDYDDEVYFTDGYYWVRRDDRWFRTRDHRGNWVVVERRVVPATIVTLPPGKYRKWKGNGRGAVVVQPARGAVVVQPGRGKGGGGHGKKGRD